MRIGVPREIKPQEYRAGLTPASVRELVGHGHLVLVEHGAGAGIGQDDAHYSAVGAILVPSAEEVFAEADLIVKVKEPQPEECQQLREGQVLFTYLHLAPDPDQAKRLKEAGCIAVAYETVTDQRGSLPLLAPMSEIAGRMSIQAGAHALEKAQGGSGILLGGAAGVPAAKVVILGGGVVGTHAARMAIGLGGEVVVIDRAIERLKELDFHFGSRIKTRYSTGTTIEEHVLTADLVIGAVLLPGAATPKLVTRAMVSRIPRGSVLVDVAIDQGGCFETSRPTTHAEPTYTVAGVVHYCVANMPGAVPRTATLALNNVTLPHVSALADKGHRQAFLDNPHLRDGLNVWRGHITHEAVARALNEPHFPAAQALASAGA